MWRGNRLVDTLAKLAAKGSRVPPTVTKQVASYAKLAQYQAARLGFATYAANHCEKVVVTDGGDTRTVVVRDTTAERP